MVQRIALWKEVQGWLDSFFMIFILFFFFQFPKDASQYNPSKPPDSAYVFGGANCLVELLNTWVPPPPTTLIPHIEVGFKWMWTQLATPNKMAPVFVDLCAGLVVLLPRQIGRFRHGFFSSAVLDWSLRGCLRVRHLWRQQIADNRRYLRRSFLPRTSSLRSQISLSKRR